MRNEIKHCISLRKVLCVSFSVCSMQEIFGSSQVFPALQNEEILCSEKLCTLLLFFRSPFPTFAPMSRKACQDILVKRNSMLSESPPRNELSYINSVESVPIHRRGLSHIEFMACGEPRERMTEVCAFLLYGHY